MANPVKTLGKLGEVFKDTGKAAEAAKGAEAVADAAKATEGASETVSGAAKAANAAKAAGRGVLKVSDGLDKHGKGLAKLGLVGVSAYALSDTDRARNVGATAANTVGGLVNGVLTGSSADQAATVDENGNVRTASQQTRQAGGGLLGGATQLISSIGGALSKDGASSLVVPALAVGAGALLLGGKSGGLGSLAKTAAVTVGGIALFEAAKDSGILDQVGKALAGQGQQQGQAQSAQASQPQTAEAAQASQPQTAEAAQPQQQSTRQLADAPDDAYAGASDALEMA